MCTDLVYSLHHRVAHEVACTELSIRHREVRAKASSQAEIVAKLDVFAKYSPKRKSQDANRYMAQWLAVITKSCTSTCPICMRNDDCYLTVNLLQAARDPHRAFLARLVM
jgi:hypothetical protein